MSWMLLHVYHEIVENADQPALQERLKLEPAELGYQDAYRPLDYLDEAAQVAILNDAW